MIHVDMSYDLLKIRLHFGNDLTSVHRTVLRGRAKFWGSHFGSPSDYLLDYSNIPSPLQKFSRTMANSMTVARYGEHVAAGQLFVPASTPVDCESVFRPAVSNVVEVHPTHHVRQ